MHARCFLDPPVCSSFRLEHQRLTDLYLLGTQACEASVFSHKPNPKNQLMIKICSFFPEVMSPEEYMQLVDIFPQIRRWSTYVEPRNVRLEQHWQLDNFRERLEDWAVMHRTIYPPFWAY